MKNKTASEILSLTIKLCLICVVVAGILAYVNSVTAPVISENEAESFDIAMKELLPEAEGFEKIENIDYTPTETGVELESLYLGKAGGEPCGYVASTVCSEGYGGDIKVMVGITSELCVADIKIMSMSETAGLGAKVGNPDYTEQYKSLKSGITVKKNNGGNKADNTISAISGATKTSNAVTKAVNCALEAAKAGGGTDE